MWRQKEVWKKLTEFSFAKRDEFPKCKAHLLLINHFCLSFSRFTPIRFIFVRRDKRYELFKFQFSIGNSKNETCKLILMISLFADSFSFFADVLFNFFSDEIKIDAFSLAIDNFLSWFWHCKSNPISVHFFFILQFFANLIFLVRRRPGDLSLPSSHFFFF